MRPSLLLSGLTGGSNVLLIVDGRSGVQIPGKYTDSDSDTRFVVLFRRTKRESVSKQRRPRTATRLGGYKCYENMKSLGWTSSTTVRYWLRKGFESCSRLAVWCAWCGG